MSRGLWYFVVIALFFLAIAFSLAGSGLGRSVTRFVRTTTQPSVQQATVHIGTATVIAEVAATDDARSRGLSGRDQLGADRGMLFVFDRPAPQVFWMEGMRFPLDIIWINDGKVVDVAENVPVPEGPPTVLTPTSFATHVLEVNAGFAAQAGVRYGTDVTVTFDGFVKP